jgi:hypothetical protein
LALGIASVIREAPFEFRLHLNQVGQFVAKLMLSLVAEGIPRLTSIP